MQALTRRGLLVLSLSTVASLAPIHAPAARAQSPDDVASVVASRNWWQDYGTFLGKANGVVYLFRNDPSGNGWRTGERATILNDFLNNRLGIAWNPFVDSGYVGVIIDHAYSREYYFFTGYDPVSEKLSWVAYTSSGWMQGYWVSTRSSLAPYKIRQQFWK